QDANRLNHPTADAYALAHSLFNFSFRAFHLQPSPSTHDGSEAFDDSRHHSAVTNDLA
ncbi:hypothetical protein EVAR_63726_1, partial [Eumeta japonica]